MKNLLPTDIRLVNAYQQTGRLFIHLHDGRTIPRMVQPSEVAAGNTVRNREGEAAYFAYWAELFNEKYSEPQVFTYPTPSRNDEALSLLEFWKKNGSLTPDQEEVLQTLRSLEGTPFFDDYVVPAGIITAPFREALEAVRRNP